MSIARGGEIRVIPFALVMLLGLCLSAQPAMARDGNEPGLDLQQLLEQVKEGRVSDNAINRNRLDAFRRDRENQRQTLQELTAEEARQEGISVERESRFEENDLLIGELETRLNERLGSLTELFGVLQQVAGDAQGNFENSLTQIHGTERNDFLQTFAQRMGQTADLPTIEEIERLWYELQWEMTETGRVVKLSMPVLNSAGQEREQEVIRVGAFNLVSEGNYYQHIPETGRVVEYGRQPAPRYMDGAGDLAAAQDSVNFSIDPTRGQLLALLVQAPSLQGRIAQGGIIGYLIIALGVIAVVIALFRLLSLTRTDRKIQQQLKDMAAPGNNPLGRIAQVYSKDKDWDTEALELKLSEAVLRELPAVNRGLGFLKIVAAVAPLMGLLGTVTGMIITFQAITLFGAGDPKLMAGGISQALVTTVLGLSVAIPILLMHQLVQARARRITELLEQEAVALVAISAMEEA